MVFALRPGLLLAAVAVALAGCPSTPTSVLLTVERKGDVPRFDQLTLDIHEDAGRVLSRRRLESASVPGNLVLYPPRPGRLRLHLRALFNASSVAEGTGTVIAEEGKQVAAKITLVKGALPDRDGDGVPDAIDNCPTLANPKQAPCGGDGGPFDGTTDARCSCTFGCKASGGCRQVIPSNGWKLLGKLPGLGSRSGTVAVDTNQCKIDVTKVLTGRRQTENNRSACVFSFSNFTLPKGVTLRASGTLPLVILVDGPCTISSGGTIDASANGSVPGPGGFAGGVPANAKGPGVAGLGLGAGDICKPCANTARDSCGGGGGGYGKAGAKGGNEVSICGAGSKGGSTYGKEKLVPLIGGSGGASGGQATTTAANTRSRGGGGGGAVQLFCKGKVTIDGKITAGGGGGQGGQKQGTPSGTAVVGIAGGGGGSGGAVLIEGQTITGQGLIAVNGGGGGGGSGRGCNAASDGKTGPASTTPAKGGARSSGTSCFGGTGGTGGTAKILPKAGLRSTKSEWGGGGGGGAAGRIRFNAYKAGTSLPMSVSGYATVGQINTE